MHATLRGTCLLALVVSALPVTELWAACTITPTTGGEWRFCDNGTCWSRSFWINNKIVYELVESGCY